jgi:hypothetical protein
MTHFTPAPAPVLSGRRYLPATSRNEIPSVGAPSVGAPSGAAPSSRPDRVWTAPLRAARAAARRSRLGAVAGAALLGLLAGCETPRPIEPPPATASIAVLYQRPPERALIQALRLYEEGAFDRAEVALKNALQLGLRDRRDAAVAHKYLAFIACAFNRIGECEQGFRNALGADSDFRLSEAEIGHPIWGPVYRRVLAAHRPEPAAPPSTTGIAPTSANGTPLYPVPPR